MHLFGVKCFRNLSISPNRTFSILGDDEYSFLSLNHLISVCSLTLVVLPSQIVCIPSRTLSPEQETIVPSFVSMAKGAKREGDDVSSNVADLSPH